MDIRKNKSHFLLLAKVLQQSGQAALEYVLLMFVIISLVTGFILNISEATQRFTQNYFGSYLECLLQTGELPRLGSDTAPDTECDDLYQPFTMAAGRPPNDSTSDGSSGSGGSGGDSQNTNASSTDKDPSSDSDSNGDSDGGNGDSASSSANSGGGADGAASDLGSFNSGRKSRVPVGSSSDKRTDADKANTLKGTNNFAQSGDDGFDSSGRTSYIPIYGSMGSDEEEEEQSDVVVAGSVDSAGQVEKSKAIPIAVKKNRDVQSEKEEEMGFGDYLRYLVIGIIILVIIIVVGGQLFQFQKSSE